MRSGTGRGDEPGTRRAGEVEPTANAPTGTAGGAEAPRLRRAALRLARASLVLFGRLPERARRRVVRQVGRTFVAGAVAVIERDGHVLLVLPVYRRGWGLPGGMVDRGEAPADTVVRELREELGLEIEPVGPVATVLDLGGERLDIVFRAHLPRAGAELQATSIELAEAGWFPLDALPELQPEAADALAAITAPERSPWVVTGRPHGVRRPDGGARPGERAQPGPQGEPGAPAQSPQ